MTTCNLYKREAVNRRCARMREAKARKRIAGAQGDDVVEVGRVTLAGTAFRGRHEIVLKHRQDVRELMVTCDGRELRPRTQRGFVAMVARAVWRVVKV